MHVDGCGILAVLQEDRRSNGGEIQAVEWSSNQAQRSNRGLRFRLSFSLNLLSAGQPCERGRAKPGQLVLLRASLMTLW